MSKPKRTGAPGRKSKKKAKVEVSDAMVAAGYVALISELPELTFALSDEDAASTVIEVYQAMFLARP